MSRAARSVFVPDLALLGACFTLLYALLLFDAPQKLFRDSDTGWHIRNGERILETGSLPRTDPYSWSKAGAAWFAWEWGSDFIMGLAHRQGGLPGVVLLYVVLLAACTWLWVQLTWRAGGDFLLACLLASPMLSTTNLHWLARPHVFGWVLLLGWLWFALHPEPRWRWQHAIFAAAGGSLWANLHASFFLLPATALILAGACAARPRIWDVAAEADRRAAGFFLGVAACSGAGSLVNPYGWQLHAHVWRYLTSWELLERIGEFQSFNFHNPGSFQILAAIAIAGLGAVLSLAQKEPGRFLLLAGFAVLALRSARALPLLALLLPLANGAVARSLRSADLRPALRHCLDSMLRYSSNLRAIERGFRGYAWAPVVLVVCAWIVSGPAIAARTGFPASEFPVQAAAAVESLPSDARLFAPDKFGGYLIYRFAGERKVYFDGRSDFYGVDFMKRYIDFVQVRPGWERMIEREGFTHALTPVNYTLAAVLPRAGWKELFRDSTAVLFERGR